MKKNKKFLDGEQKIKISTLIYAVLTVVVFVFALMSVLAYGTNTTIGQRIAQSMSRVIPFPAVIVDYTHVVYLGDVEKNLASVQRFYQTHDLSAQGLQIDFNTPDGQKKLMIKQREILEKMVEDKAIEILAKERGVVVSKQDIDGAVADKLAEYGNAQDVKKDLMNSYGWTMDDFKQRVVMPDAYKTALTQLFLAEDKSGAQARTTIEKAKQDLDSGKDFVDAVRMYSQGASREQDGELGWVKKQQLLPELQAALFGASQPEKNAIIESSVGFHVIQIEGRKQENGEMMLQLRQVFVQKNTFADWLASQMKQMHIWVPLKEFTWDKNEAMIDFRDQNMRQYEQDARKNATGDASLML